MRFWLCAVTIVVGLLGSSAVVAAQDDAGPTQLSIATPADSPLSFDTDTLEATAGADVVVTYTNGSSIPHNWHLFASDGPSGKTVAKTPLAAGPGGVQSVEFTAADPGSYYFVCDIHPDMSGQLVVSSPD